MPINGIIRQPDGPNKLIKSWRPSRRIAAIKQIASRGLDGKTLWPMLVDAVDDRFRSVRFAALRALQKQGPEVLPWLLDGYIRMQHRQAEFALVIMHIGSSALEALASAAEEGIVATRCAAMKLWLLIARDVTWRGRFAEKIATVLISEVSHQLVDYSLLNPPTLIDTARNCLVDMGAEAVPHLARHYYCGTNTAAAREILYLLSLIGARPGRSVIGPPSVGNPRVVLPTRFISCNDHTDFPTLPILNSLPLVNDALRSWVLQCLSGEQQDSLLESLTAELAYLLADDDARVREKSAQTLLCLEQLKQRTSIPPTHPVRRALRRHANLVAQRAVIALNDQRQIVTRAATSVLWMTAPDISSSARDRVERALIFIGMSTPHIEARQTISSALDRLAPRLSLIVTAA